MVQGPPGPGATSDSSCPYSTACACSGVGKDLSLVRLVPLQWYLFPFLSVLLKQPLEVSWCSCTDPAFTKANSQ